MWADVGEDKIWESNGVELLGTTIDGKMKIDKHVSKLYPKASWKLRRTPEAYLEPNRTSTMELFSRKTAVNCFHQKPPS